MKGDVGSTPGQGSKVPDAVGCSQTCFFFKCCRNVVHEDLDALQGSPMLPERAMEEEDPRIKFMRRVCDL